MNPEEIINKLFEGFQQGKGDIKIIPKEDGGFGLIYGNNGRKGVYEINPKVRTQNSSVNYDELLYDPSVPGLKEFGADSSKIEGSKQEIVAALRSGKYDLNLIGQYDKDQLIENYNRTQRKLNPNNQVLGIPQAQTEQGQPEQSGLDPQLGFGLTEGSTFGGTAKTLGALAYNGLAETAINVVESTYGVGKDVVKGGIGKEKVLGIPYSAPGVTKFAKDVYGGILNLAGSIGSAGTTAQVMLQAWMNNGELPTPEVIAANYNLRKEAWSQMTDAISPVYSNEEKQLVVDSYNDQYTKSFEDFKKDVTVPFKTPEGEPSWNNPDWVASTLASGIQSGIGFMGGLYASNFLLTKGAGAIGKTLGTAAGENEAFRLAKNKSDLLKKIDSPDFEKPAMRDYLKSRIGRVTVNLEDAAAKGKHAGEVIGSSGAMIGATKFESDLEGFQAYEQYMTQAREKKSKELADSGMSLEEVQQTMENLPMEEEKAVARAKAENVRKANMVILGLSNLATFKLLGLSPKSNMTKNYGAVIANGVSDDLAPITNELFSPWYSRLGKTTLETGKEGWEESWQTGITKYEASKDSESNSAMQTIVGGGTTAFQDLLNLDPETTMSFITGAATSGGFNAARWGFGAIRKNREEKKLKFIDADKVNSVVTDPLTNEDNVRGHLKYTVEAIQNEIGKGVAEMTKDWQLQHVLEQEGINKLYYQARENGVEHNDATKFILGALKARTNNTSVKENTPYSGNLDEKNQIGEVEQGLKRASQAYDYIQRAIKSFLNKDLNVSPELRKRIFEAVANAAEFDELGKYLEQKKGELGNDKVPIVDVERDLKINSAYNGAYAKILPGLINDLRGLKKDSDDHKAEIINTAQQETKLPVEQIAKDMSNSPQEEANLINIANKNTATRTKARFRQETAHFQQQVDSFFREGQVRNSLGDVEALSYDNLESLIQGYNEAVEPLLENEKDRKEFEKQKKEIVTAAVNRLRDVTGSQGSDEIDQRYNNSEVQRSYLFSAERDMLAGRLQGNPEVDINLVQAIRETENVEDLSAILNSPERTETEARIIGSFYSEGPNMKSETIEETQDDSLLLDDVIVDDNQDIPFDTEVLTLEDLFRDETLIRPCNL